MQRRTRRVPVGETFIGGDSDVLIQSMTNTDTADTQATAAQIAALEGAGCEAVRCAFYSKACASAFREIKRSMRVPLIADVHFDAELAVLAMESGADKVRINPGNLRGPLKRVVDCAKQNGAALRVGVNAGSLEAEVLEEYGGLCPEALAKSALSWTRRIYGMGFERVVVSIKSSSVPTGVEANRLFSAQCDAPLHIGVTEAGTFDHAIVKSAVGLGALLLEGIGDTVRVSVTGDPVQEVGAARRIVQACGVRTFYPEVISCPTCGRTGIDVVALAHRVEALLVKLDRPLVAAVMGCVVNGPGEAKHADIGIAGGGDGKAVLFAKGKRIATGTEAEIFNQFVRYIEDNFRFEAPRGAM
jgi:(E)-4-hydroxy-3-methylbut-2-enyl-diphosphate synthase